MAWHLYVSGVTTTLVSSQGAVTGVGQCDGSGVTRFVTLPPPKPFVEGFGIPRLYGVHQELSEPVRVKPGLAAANQQFLAYEPRLLAFTNSAFYQPLSEPVRVKPRLLEANQQFLAYEPFIQAFTRFAFFQALSEPIRRKPTLEGFFAQNIFPIVTTVIFTNWFQALSEPVRAKPPSPRPFAGQVDVETTQFMGWFTPLSDPTRRIVLNPSVSNDAFILPQIFTNWFEGLSEPVRINPRLLEASQQFLAYDPFPFAFTNFAFFQPLSEPVRRIRFLEGWFAQNIFPLPFSFTWFEGLSEPVRSRPFLASLQQFLAQDPQEIIFMNWFNALSEPVRRKPFLEGFFAQNEFPIVTVTQFLNWFAYYTDPIFRKPSIPAGADAVLVIATPQVPPSWFEALSPPPPPKLKILEAAQQFFASNVFPIVTPMPTGQAPGPVLSKPRLLEASQQFIAYDPFPFAFTNFAFFEALSEPVRTRWFNAALQDVFASNIFPIVTPLPSDQYPDPVRRKPTTPEGFFAQNIFPIPTATIFTNWYASLSEPVRTKLGLLASEQQFLAYDPFPFAFTTLNWFENLSNPVRIPLRATQTFSDSFSIPIVQVFINWFAGLSEPVRARTLPTAQQQFGAYDPFPFVFTGLVSASSVSVQTVAGLVGLAFNQSFSTPIQAVFMNWFAGLSEPVRRRDFPAAQQQFLAYEPFPFIFTGMVSLFGTSIRTAGQNHPAYFGAFAKSEFPITFTIPWFEALSEPVRRKPFLEGIFAQNEFPLPTVLFFGWFTALTDPTRVRRGIPPGADQTVPFGVPQLPPSWYNDLAPPPPPRQRLIEALQQFIAFYPLPTVFTSFFFSQFADPVRRDFRAGQLQFLALDPFPFAFTNFAFFEALSEPVRQKPGLNAAAQQFFTANIFPIPTPINFPNWYEALSEPVRTKPGLLPSLQQFLAYDPFPFAFTSMAFFEALSEPVRVKPGLLAAQQPFYPAFDPFPFTFTNMAFFQAFSEPVRQRPLLHPALQQFLVFTSTPVIQITYTIRLAATENKDVFFGNLRTYNPPAFAYVSIVDLGPQPAYVSIVELTHFSAYVSIVEE